MKNNTTLTLCSCRLQLASLIIGIFFATGSPVRAADLDLSHAVIVGDRQAAGPIKEAVRMLVEEAEKRTQVRWAQSGEWPAGEHPVIAIGLSSFVEPLLKAHGVSRAESPGFEGAEGYRIRVFSGKPSIVMVAGNDARGVLFGVGRLLRALRMSTQRARLPDNFNIATVPKDRLRGHQLGYRPKTNSYDAWTVAMWEQYIRDLVIFGANAVELLPPRTDDDASSPHFPLPPMAMMIEMSKLLDRYGLDVWVWYPAMDRDNSDPKTVEAALKEWAGVLKQLPRVDAVFVPGGDPGHTDPKHLMPFLEKQARSLRKHHPKLQMWMSPQGFNAEWMQWFLDHLQREQPDWLAGLVYGPQVRMSLPAFREAVPKIYPIRRYPDITHSRQSQYSVPQWDTAFAVTEGREVINPRPLAQAKIYRGALRKQAIGFISYSEGCNDDVNKFVWSGLGWDPEASVQEILRDYSRYFIGEKYADDFSKGLFALEQNWKGPLLANAGVVTTLQQFQDMERGAAPAVAANWRFQQALYRAYYDAFIYHRNLLEADLEKRALDRLDQADRIGADQAMIEARAILDLSQKTPAAPELRARVFALGDALFQSIRMQLSVSRHKAIEAERGATLDTIDMPLSNHLWLKRRFGEIGKLQNDRDKLQELRQIVHWTDPGPGGFYDDLGDETRQPHLLPGVGFDIDPGMFQTPRFGWVIGAPYYALFPKSWWSSAEVIYDGPLKMQYNDLDPEARYAARISYVSDSPRTKIRLLADDQYEIHPEITKPQAPAFAEYEMPAAATRDGKLTLTWYRQRGFGGNGRGNTVTEVWLMRKPK